MKQPKQPRKIEGEMKHLCALLIVCGIAAASSAGFGQPGEAPFTLTISTDKPTVVAGSQVIIKITQTNTSDQAIGCASADSNGFQIAFRHEVLDEDGKSVKIPGEHHEFRDFSWRGPCNLAPGESTSRDSQITALYDLTKPGKYTVQVSSQASSDEKDGEVKSNTITITVLPADGPPPTQ